MGNLGSNSFRQSLIIGATRAYAKIAPTERGGYAIMRAARNCLPASQWQNIYSVRGLKLSLDLGIYPDCCMASGIYELDTYRVINRLLKPGGWFVDGGANIGYFSLLASKLVGPTGRVDSFEPDPENLSRFQTHTSENDAGNVHLHPVALSDQREMLSMIHPDRDSGNHGMSSSFFTEKSSGSRFEVQAVRLEEQLLGVPDLIKLDVEGAELKALKGMSGLLSGPHPPKVIVEHNHATSAAAGYSPADLFNFLTSLNPSLRIYWIGWRLTSIQSAEHLQNITRQGNLLIL
jgi:FkbM family methyltransferase